MADVIAAFPRGFYCEHTLSKVRIYALVGCAGGPETLVALVSLADPEVAGRVADILNTALEAIPGTALVSLADPAPEPGAGRPLSPPPRHPTATTDHELRLPY